MHKDNNSPGFSGLNSNKETKPNDKFQGDVKDFILIRDKESGTAIVKSRG